MLLIILTTTPKQNKAINIHIHKKKKIFYKRKRKSVKRYNEVVLASCLKSSIIVQT